MSNGSVPLTACQQLAMLQTQMALYLSGQAPAAIETPQLGRVEFSKTSVGDIQRLIDNLTYQCAIENGDYCAARRARRRPISMEAWP
jgi:hypothetical protein